MTNGRIPPTSHLLPPGTALKDERYLVEKMLDEDVFTIAYLGFDQLREQKVLIKEYYSSDRMSRDTATSSVVIPACGWSGKYLESGRERFLQEAEAISQIDAPGRIAWVRDHFQENNTAYTVMEYVEGVTFRELMVRKGGNIPCSELLPMVDPLLHALHDIHRQGLIHWSINPDNLILTKTGVYLTGWGCSPDAYCAMTAMPFILRHGFVPVEQYQGKGPGPQGLLADVYALSASIYYCLTGCRPPSAIDRLLTDKLIPPRQLGAELTPGQETALLQGMGVLPKDRLQSMEELHTTLCAGDPAPRSPRSPQSGFWPWLRGR